MLLSSLSLRLCLGLGLVCCHDLKEADNDPQMSGLIFTENLLFERKTRCEIDCARVCSKTDRCVTFTFTPVTSGDGVCRGHSSRMNSSTAHELSAGTDLYDFRQDTPAKEIHAVLNDGSVLLFRVTPGINQSAYDRFTAIGDNDDNTAELLQTVPVGCKTTDGSLPCDRHYRSRLLDQSPLSFKTIRVGLYKDGGEQAFFEFNATGANYTNWFRRERILTSSYTDTLDGNYFSVEGDGGRGRRFFINHNYGGSHRGAGWLVVVDKSYTGSSWERNAANSYPSVLYMAGTSSGVWNNTGRTVADSLVISGRLDTSSPASP